MPLTGRVAPPHPFPHPTPPVVRGVRLQVSLPLLHWIKIASLDQQNIYDNAGPPTTFWDQIDDGKLWTATRKGLVVLPVVLYLLATNTADFRRQPLFLNLVAMLALVIPKLPCANPAPLADKDA